MSLETSTDKRAQPRDLREPADRLSATSKDDDQLPSDKEHEVEKSDGEHTPPTDDTDIEKHATSDLPPSAPPEIDPNLVVFDGPDDPGNPLNWPVRKRIAITLSMGMMTFVVTFSSSIFATALQPVAEEFNIGETVATLGVALFLLGFVLGPIAFGPASEVFGRRIPLFSGYIVFAIFQIPVAVAQNVETIMICRFIGGFAASAPLAVVGGSLADIWGPLERAYAICVFAANAFSGPVAGPIIGGFVVQSHLGWRWTQWLTLIMAALFGSIGLFVIPETSAARILQTRAKRLRYETKNWALHAKADENRITVRTILTVYLIRPFVMLAQEPILALVTAYMSFLYGVLYLLFEAYPIEYHEIRGWSLGVSALPFCAFLVGIAGGTALMAYSTATNFKRAYIKHGKAVPEERLPPMIICAVILPIALFWFAWTSQKHISWVPSVIATGFLGGSLLVTFWQGINYLIDCYGFYSNRGEFVRINELLLTVW
ncbi:hypothetical protein LTR56_009858 [Elasticomyces elasticus]|nr:hypothetical protein LTR56_009858 [Elasticomyces elasticus]KAK3659174.1 hypothetical protein LTR22_008637 [Elasticomyces elasticus]KAK4923149.1 hypothetical protein LTR49_009617 [Elasticomyces elasticus]KAK5761534.1 hypothetical protein LTS12_008326 [Elasticomyces elasticus]